MSHEQLERQKGYSLSVLILWRLHDAGLLSNEELMEADALLREKYQPCITLCTSLI